MVAACSDASSCFPCSWPPAFSGRTRPRRRPSNASWRRPPSPDVTVVHLWAPWCSECKTELADGAWSAFITANPQVHFIFVTVWNDADGHELLQRNGLGAQPNFQLLLHPNGSRKRGEKVTELLGLPVSWIPSTWIFKKGHLYYAMNYGELHFPMLQQLIKDSTTSW